MANTQILIIPSKQNVNYNGHDHYNLLKKGSSYFSSQKYHLITDNKPEYNKEGGVILFGCKDYQYPIIDTEKTSIGNNWFKNSLKVGVFFMPDGHKLLKHTTWQNIFPSWVTFKGKYQFLINDLPILNRLIPKTYIKIFKLIKELTNSQEIKKAIEQVYDEVMIEIYKSEMKRNDSNKHDMTMSIYKIRSNRERLIAK